jgi:hypothetical protein
MMGVCEACPDGTVECGNACVDTMSSEMHCGGCNISCTGDPTCTAGECTCPVGLQRCGTKCVDWMTSDMHCGECNHNCPGMQTCMSGECG